MRGGKWPGYALGGGGLALAAGLLYHHTLLGVALFAAGGAAVAWGLAALLPLWGGARVRLRVRYHAPAGGAALGPLLLAVAGAAECGLRLLWQRRGGEWRLYLEAPAALGELLAERLPAVLPDAQLEPLAGWPPGAGGGCYRWANPPADTPGDWPILAWLAAAPFVDDLDLWVHLSAAGGAVLVQGTPAPGGLPWPQELRPWGRLLGRRPAWGARLLAGYPLLDPWPGGPPALALPATGGPGTARLDTQASSQVLLPATYACPPGFVVGTTPADDQAVGFSLAPAPPGPFLVVGGAREDRRRLLESLAAQATAAGAHVVRFVTPEPAVRESAGGPQGGDLPEDDPLPLNLLAVPPVPGRGSPAAGEAAALVAALEDHIPLLGRYLEWLGLAGWNPTSGYRLVLDHAQLGLLAYHRARLLGPGAPAAPPDLAGVVAGLDAAAGFAALMATEVDEWGRPGARVARVLAEAGAEGAAAAALARSTLAGLQARLAREEEHVRAMRAATAQGRLQAVLPPALLHPSAAQARSPLAVFGSGEPCALQTVLAFDLAVPAGALYRLVNVLAAGRARARAGGRGPPLLLILEGLPWAIGRAVSADRARLAAGNCTVVIAQAQLGAVGSRVLAEAGGWHLGALDPGDAAAVHRELATAGVGGDLPLTRLAAGTALVRVPSPIGPVIATVRCAPAAPPVEGGVRMPIAS